MERTPPRVTRRNNRNGQSNSAQAQGGAQLHPDVDEDSSSPAPQPNTPSPGNTSSSTDQLLQRILEELENLKKEVRDNKRDADARFQDLNALMIQQTSPRRADRPNSPTPRSQTPPRRTQTPPQDDEDDIYGQPNPPRTYKPEPRPFPPQDARVSTNPERFYANYPPLPSSQHPSRQPSLQPSQQPFQQPPRPPFQANSPYPQDLREKTPRPNDIAPYDDGSGKGATGSTMKLGLKPPPFHGLDTEHFAPWLYTVELYFYTNKLPGDEYFLNGLMLLEGDAHAFAYDLMCKNNGKGLSWDEFKYHMRERYDNAELRDEMLKEHLKSMRYHGPARMDEFCTVFRNIEMQISSNELTLKTRLDIFMKSMPTGVKDWVILSGTPSSMDTVYQMAHKWARAHKDQHPQRIKRLRNRE